MKLNLSLVARMAAAAFVLAAALAVLLLAGGPSYGSNPVQRGASCDRVGQVKANRDGVKYICEQRPDDGGCPRWHAYRPQPGPWPSRSTLPCAKCSPSPSKSPSASASVSPSISPSKSTSPTPSKATAAGSTQPAPSLTPAGNTTDDRLPVTGTRDVIRYAGVGLALIGFGAFLRFGIRSIRRRTT